MNELKEFAVAIIRMILGIVVLMGAMVVIDLVMYISFASSTSTETITKAYYSGYEDGYAEMYLVAYQEAGGEAYNKGYDKWYGIGMNGLSQAGDPKVKLYNPKYTELQEFLARDQTDSNLFISGEYVCFDFAAALNNSAEARSIRAAYVRIRSREWAHAVVAFETVDKGLIFIEPQSDREVRLVVGEPYAWQRAGARGTAYYDDSIVEIQIIW